MAADHESSHRLAVVLAVILNCGFFSEAVALAKIYETNEKPYSS